MSTVVDLRSDTVTKPTNAMRQAMFSAEVGDDVYGDDPTVNALEAKAAAMLGKEAALLVPSGTMGNAAAMLAHLQRGDQVITGRRAHMYANEQGGAAVLAGAFPAPIDENPDGTLPLEQVEAVIIKGEDDHWVRSRLIAIENTHNACGGRPLTAEYTATVADLAHRYGLQLHIDGARLFNAAVALNTPVADLVAPADSVMFCLSKGLSAPVGSMVVGRADFIRQARRARKLLGGGMRQAGVLAAAGIQALETMVARLAEDHVNARALAAGLAALPGIDLALDSVCTNMVYFGIRPEVGMTADELTARLKALDVLVGPVGPFRIRAVTHSGVNRVMVDTAVAAVGDVLSA